MFTATEKRLYFLRFMTRTENEDEIMYLNNI